ncbi:lytic transglycosylase domain-containing protein [Vibrio coralliirubri]|uniref:lytic transglycosylase domain-containing protein n=1 Tax=Vibrio coralliirubri TaxID=1516159 RepID=UPI00228478AD|nr:lytic transglycosylase domain-containing protein [Vibrio coralliirubri]MCY9861079.1 lytic transglycosylase domain-containing protein [Vibrio coralliirubri]
MRHIITVALLLFSCSANAIYNYKSYPWTDRGDKLVAYAAVHKDSLLKNAKGLYPNYTKYAPAIREIAAKHKVPLEIVTLAAIESGFRAKAKSPVGAAGMWQFMKPTARDYGLKVDNGVDERLDWQKSTEAAVRYIKWLAEVRFGNDYETAIMAYNYGVGNMDKIIAKAKTPNAWVLINANLIPLETEEHLLRFLIYTQIFKHLDIYGIQ